LISLEIKLVIVLSCLLICFNFRKNKKIAIIRGIFFIRICSVLRDRITILLILLLLSRESFWANNQIRGRLNLMKLIEFYYLKLLNLRNWSLIMHLNNKNLRIFKINKTRKLTSPSSISTKTKKSNIHSKKQNFNKLKR
jgi:hypothetical protein